MSLISAPQGIEKGQRWRKGLVAILLLLAAVLIVKSLLVGRHVYALWTHGMRLKSLVYDPGLMLKPEGPARMRADLERVVLALAGVRAELRPVLKPAWLPWRAVRENLSAVDELLRIGSQLAQAGQVAADGLQSVADAVEASRTAAKNPKAQAVTEVLFTGLLAARPYFAQVEQEVGRSYEETAVLGSGSLWQPLARGVGALEHYLRLGRSALGAAAAAPKLLGEDGPVTYLVLAQNNDELRATGGFITGIGEVTIERGKISQLTIKDSYDFDKFTVDHPFAPGAMQRYMSVFLWVTRDGNWSPDFPTAARDVENLYHLEHSTEIGGVVAFDMLAVQALVQAVGPLYLEEYQDQIDGANVLQKMREYWAPSLPAGTDWEQWAGQGWQKIKQEWWSHRKDFMGLVAQALMAKLQQRKPDQLSSLLWTVKHAMDEKHILLSFHEPAAQELLTASGMDGALDHGSPGDYLLALDTNMGYNKVNLNVEKSVEYQVTLARNTAPEATLTITYTNRCPAKPTCQLRARIEETYDLMAQGCYWNYLRVYAPLGSQLLAAEGLTQSAAVDLDQGKRLFAAYLVVPANESRTVRLTYRLPDLGSQEYSLLVQKQAGTEAVPLKVRVVLPPGTAVSSSEPKPRRSQEGQRTVVSYELDLRQDRFLALRFR